MGLASAFFSDIAFIALIPALLGDVGFTSSDIAFMMTVHFGCDLAGRLCYSLLNIIYSTKNRYVYYTGAFVTALFRIRKYYNWPNFAALVVKYPKLSVSDRILAWPSKL